MPLDVLAYLNQLKASHPQNAADLGALEELYSRRLWHQLTVKLLDLLKAGAIPTSGNLDLYHSFVVDVENKLNPLALVEIVLYIVRGLSDPGVALDFLRKLADKIKHEQSAYIVAITALADCNLGFKNTDAAKKLLEEASELLEGMNDVDLRVFAAYYRVAAAYNKTNGSFGEFYKDALRYLGCVELSSLPPLEQQVRAFDISLAALLSDDIYNFGELLAHPILETLRGTEHEWLIELLYAFNSGNIAQFNAMTPQWSKQSDLAAHDAKLKQKITLLALMELVFQHPADSRAVPFSEIASHTLLSLNEVEFLLMKALSLGLIRGSLDGIDQVATISWVQPRVLDVKQILSLRDRLAQWCNRVSNVSTLVETDAPELIL